MNRVAALLFMAFAAGAAPAWAAAPAAKGADQPDRALISPNIVTPVIRDGKLVNYLFVTVRVEVSDSADLWRTRERIQFLRDALLRASHRVSLASADRDDQLNAPLALATFRAAADETLGAANVKVLTIEGVDSLRRR